MDPASEWSALAGPWRAVAERHGFRLLDRSVQMIEGGHQCVDYLASGATFLDLSGQLGRVHGFWSATLITWLDAGEGRFSLWTFGEKEPPPRPPGLAGFLAARFLRPLMHKLAGASRPVLMRAPDDLEAVISRHMGELLAAAGKPVTFDSLDSRFEQTRRDERVRA